MKNSSAKIGIISETSKFLTNYFKFNQNYSMIINIKLKKNRLICVSCNTPQPCGYSLE